ncbi:MAG: site-specific integrase, partial [Chitinophagaceae bacterium]
MITLPEGCYCSDLSVFPKDWQKSGASIAHDWYIHYRYYDPTVLDAKGKIKPKMIIIKGMNSFKTLGERRESVAGLIKQELSMLRDEGYNPITKQFMIKHQDVIEYEIDPSTPFIEALRKSVDRLEVTHNVRKDMKGILNKVDAAAKQLRMSYTTISKISKRDMKYLLEQCGRNSEAFSNHRYNTYRGYLMMMFKELVELEAAPTNIMRDISKKGVTKKIKDVLTEEQRILIDEHLQKEFPRFRMFIHLFFHSGGRKTELLQLKPGMVNLQKQTYRCIIKKRREYTEVDRTIKTIALPFWKFFLEGCGPGQFLFGTLFEPGDKPIGEGMPTQYWKEYVKWQLKIDIDFYSLKHLNTTELVDQFDEAAAAAQD